MRTRPPPQLSLFSLATLLPGAPPDSPPVDPSSTEEPDPAPLAPLVAEASESSDLISLDEALAMLRAARENETARQRALDSLSPEARQLKQHASLFLLEHGRLPRIGDEIPPWRYCGWLRPYVQMMHGQKPQLLGDRWGYYAQTLQAGRLLDEPIPQAHFSSTHGPTMSAIEKWVGLIEQSGQSVWGAFSLFVDWLAWGLDVGPEPKIDDKLNEKLYRTVNLWPWIETPGDYLGALASDRFGGGPFAFFPTPMCITEMMTKMLLADLDTSADQRLKTVNEPCCGTGRMLLAASNFSMRLSGIDKDPLMVLICKINMVLYAPWGLYGLPWLRDTQAGVRVADALKMCGPIDK